MTMTLTLLLSVMGTVTSRQPHTLHLPESMPALTPYLNRWMGSVSRDSWKYKLVNGENISIEIQRRHPEARARTSA